MPIFMYRGEVAGSSERIRRFSTQHLTSFEMKERLKLQTED
jgi:hypothetical protein